MRYNTKANTMMMSEREKKETHILVGAFSILSTSFDIKSMTLPVVVFSRLCWVTKRICKWIKLIIICKWINYIMSFNVTASTDKSYPSPSLCDIQSKNCRKIVMLWFQFRLFLILYYYMREQWYFSLIWYTYMWKLETFCGQWYRQIIAWFARDIWYKYHSWCFKIVPNFTRLTAREITYNNFEISLVVFMPNITTSDAFTYTNTMNPRGRLFSGLSIFYQNAIMCDSARQPPQKAL